MNENFESIAISSRIRLARNISGFNFFTKLREDSDAVFIIEKVFPDPAEAETRIFLLSLLTS